MTEYVVAKKISIPDFAQKPGIAIKDRREEEAQIRFAPHTEKILDHLHNELERSFNDPDMFFLKEESGFPLRQEITGEYYVSDIQYGGDKDKSKMLVTFNCLGKDSGSVVDYVSMKTLVTLDNETQALSYEQKFQHEVI